MATDLLAIISKAVFEAQFPDAAPDSTLALDRYISANPNLTPLADGGRLFLVTVRPPDEQLWLVGVLENPRHDGKAWVAKPNRVAVRDVSSVRGKIRFVSDTGISAKPGALGMSLQTPRALTSADVALLLGAKPQKPTKAANPPKPSKSADGPLETALSKNDWPKALELARTQWQDTRAPDLATVITQVSTQLPALTEWTAPRTALNLTQLFSLLTTGVRFADALDRLQSLVKLPADPRIANGLVDFLLTPPFTAQSSREFWNVLFAALEDRHADPRTITRLKPTLAKYLDIFGGTVMGNSVKKRAESLVATLEQKFSAPLPEFPDLLAAAPKAPEKKVAAKDSIEHLYEAVYEHPDDDGARAVLADALLEAGDARGEFITLQLRGASRTPDELKREAALLKKHGKDWAGVLAGCTYNDQNVFEKGFITECRLRLLGGKLNPALNHPSWATVKTLHIAIGGTKEHGATLLAQPAMRHLKSLHSAPYDVVQSLAEKAMTHELELLEVSWMQYADGDERRFDPKYWDTLLQTKALPKLKTLRLEVNVAPETLDTFWASPLAKRLSRLELMERGQLGALLTDAQTRAPKTLEVTISAADLTFTTKKGEVTVSHTPPPDSDAKQWNHWRGQLIAQLPKDLALRLEGLPAELAAAVKARCPQSR